MSDSSDSSVSHDSIARSCVQGSIAGCPCFDNRVYIALRHWFATLFKGWTKMFRLPISSRNINAGI